MFRTCLPLALLVAFSGTPLRIAEAASDLARWVVEAGESAEIELVDGGVGDDSGESIRADVALDTVAAPLPCLATEFLRIASPTRLGSPLLATIQPDPPPETRRHFLLQCFLC